MFNRILAGLWACEYSKTKTMNNPFFDNGIEEDPSTLPVPRRIIQECKEGACNHYRYFEGPMGVIYYEMWNENGHWAERKPGTNLTQPCNENYS